METRAMETTMEMETRAMEMVTAIKAMETATATAMATETKARAMAMATVMDMEADNRGANALSSVPIYARESLAILRGRARTPEIRE
jgi:hypothetical protein